MSRRTERVAHVIRNVVADAIRQLSDPRIEPLTSVTRVEVSPDLSVAHVRVSVMAAEARRELCVRALQHAAGRIRAELAGELRLRKLPLLQFHLDESVRRGFEAVRQLDQLMEDLGERPAWSVAVPEPAAPAAPDGGPDAAQAGSDSAVSAAPSDGSGQEDG